MMTQKRAKTSIRRSIAMIVLIMGALLVLIPFAWLFSTSLKPNAEIFRLPPKWLPSQWQWENYPQVWHRTAFGRYYANSIIVALGVIVGQLITSALAAYAFARLRFRGRDALFFCYLATLMIPGAVTMIPLFILFRFIGSAFPYDVYLFNRFYIGAPIGLDSLAALIAPGCFSAYGTFLLRQAFLGIPRELEEAITIDGGGHWTIFTKIALPLNKPSLTTLAIFVLLGTWRDFLWPLVTITRDELKTLPIGLASFQGMYSTDWSLLMAASLMVMVPLVIIFFAAQQFFIEGVKLQGIKG
jgi:multiple sugar transport system permease protein